MKFRLLIMVLFLLGAVLALPSLAAQPKAKANALTKYISSKFYEKTLFQTASSFAALKVICEQPHFRVKRESQEVLAPVSFQKGKIHPVKGIWFERLNVVGCGKTMIVDVTVITDPETPPEFTAAEVQDADKASR